TIYFNLFFFSSRRRHTRSKRDWSSDVCSSDLEMAKEIPKRSEVPKELTWNLESIFETDEAWEKEFTSLKEDIAQITAYQGKLGNSSDDLYHMFVLQDQLSERVGKLRSEERRVGKEWI